MKKKKKRVFYDELGVVRPTDGIKRYKFTPTEVKYKLEVKGNSKLGPIAVWSTLMGKFIYKRLPGVLKDIEGTCTNCDACSTSCYCRNGYCRHPSEIFNHAKNTWGIRNDIDKVAADLAAQLSRGRISTVRINSSGEIENSEQLSMWCTLAYSHPDVKFYLYTKNYKLATKFLLNGLVPENFVILFSVWGRNGLKAFNRTKHLKNVKAFVFDDGAMRIEPQVHCPAYVKKFKFSNKYRRTDIHCNDCKMCFSSNIKVIACHEH